MANINTPQREYDVDDLLLSIVFLNLITYLFPAHCLLHLSILNLMISLLCTFKSGEFMLQ